MRKLYLFLFLGLFLISLASADVSIGTVKQGSTIQLTQTCSNCTYVNLTSVLYPDNTYALNGQYSMQKTGTNFNYTFSDTNTLGDYVYSTCGDLNGVNTCQSVSFEVTPNGDKLKTDKAILYTCLLAILFCLDLILFLVIRSIEPTNYVGSDGETVGISLKKYMRIILIGVSYGLVLLTLNLMVAVSNSLTITQFSGIIGGIFTIMLRGSIVWTFVIMTWIAITAWKDSQMVKEIKKRFEEGEWLRE